MESGIRWEWLPFVRFGFVWFGFRINASPGRLCPNRWFLDMNQETVKGKNTEGRRRVVKSEELFDGFSEVMIEHKNNFYRLLVTKAGKLILNK